MRPSFGLEEAQRCYDYILSGGFMTEFRVTRELEGKIADLVGVKHCFMNPNGTLAICAGLNALGVGVGDKVIVPTYTMVATANAVRFIGAVPVFVDVDWSGTLSCFWVSILPTIWPEVIGGFQA
jgi:perosamine synthetase